MKFNEDSRVKLPAILHLTQLGYTYLPLKDSNQVFESTDSSSKSSSEVLRAYETNTTKSTGKPKTRRASRLVVAYVDEWAGYCW